MNMKTLIKLLLLITTIYITCEGVRMETKLLEVEKSSKEALATIQVEPVVYEEMTLSELITKLNRNLTSTVKGKGSLFASYALEQGVDPYLAVAIMLHETGCTWECSTLVKKCNNVGGQKGSPSCGSSGYKRFSSLDEGIKNFIDNLKENYVDQGLTNASLMQKRYTGKTVSTWEQKVNYYINKIKKS